MEEEEKEDYGGEDKEKSSGPPFPKLISMRTSSSLERRENDLSKEYLVVMERCRVQPHYIWFYLSPLTNKAGLLMMKLEPINMISRSDNPDARRK